MTAVAVVSRPHTVTAIDLEGLLQWAYAQTATISYRNASPRALAFNHGYTAIPHGCHSIFEGGDTAVALLPKSADDAKVILAAVETLDPWTQAIIAANARGQRRPDWMEGVEPKLVPVKVSWRKRSGSKHDRKKRERVSGKRHVSTVEEHWQGGISPARIRQCRDAYSRWHAGLLRLVPMLEGRLSEFMVKGLAAPSTPWESEFKKTA